MREYTFRNITLNELDAAHGLHVKVVDKLLTNNIRQWLKPIDKNKLLERQLRNENFGLFNSAGELLVFLSLVHRNKYFEWDSYITETNTKWLNTVSVNVNYPKQQLGEIAINKLIDYCKNSLINSIYLDCVLNDGFLKDYYSRFGFKVLAQQTTTYRSGTFEMILMKLEI